MQSKLKISVLFPEMFTISSILWICQSCHGMPALIKINELTRCTARSWKTITFMDPKGIVEGTNIFTELKIYIHTNCYNKTTTEIILNAYFMILWYWLKVCICFLIELFIILATMFFWNYVCWGTFIGTSVVLGD